MGYKFNKDSNKNMFSDSYNEEELVDDGDKCYDYDDDIDEDEDDDDDDEAEVEDEEFEEKGLDFSFACEDCDYRWDDFIVGEKEEIEKEDFDVVCPMCGSLNISQI